MWIVSGLYKKDAQTRCRLGRDRPIIQDWEKNRHQTKQRQG